MYNGVHSRMFFDGFKHPRHVKQGSLSGQTMSISTNAIEQLGFSPTRSSLVSKHGPMSTYPLHTNTPCVYFPSGPFLTSPALFISPSCVNQEVCPLFYVLQSYPSHPPFISLSSTGFINLSQILREKRQLKWQLFVFELTQQSSGT